MTLSPNVMMLGSLRIIPSKTFTLSKSVPPIVSIARGHFTTSPDNYIYDDTRVTRRPLENGFLFSMPIMECYTKSTSNKKNAKESTSTEERSFQFAAPGTSKTFTLSKSIHRIFPVARVYSTTSTQYDKYNDTRVTRRPLESGILFSMPIMECYTKRTSNKKNAKESTSTEERGFQLTRPRMKRKLSSKREKNYNYIERGILFSATCLDQRVQDTTQ